MISQTTESNIVNNVNVSADSSGGSSSHTKITTTTNGKTTVVESNESGSIHVETVNGETKIETSPGMKVQVNEGEAKVETTISPTDSPATISAEEVEKKVKEIKKDVKEKKASILEIIRQKISDFFAKFGFTS